jgi:subtilisin family serine protease
MSAPLKEIVEYAATKERGGKGVVILFAAGNGNEDISDPRTLDGFAANPWVFAVGAVNASGVKAMYSDFGIDLDILAPSCDIDLDDYADPFDMEKIRDGIWTTDNTGFDGYAAGDHTPGFCGTSSATPLAAGIVGLMLAADPELTRDDIYAIITGTADKVSPGDARYDQNGFSLRYGYGRVNALAAVTAVCADGCPGAAPVDEDPVASPEAEVDFVENMNTVTDDDGPLASAGPSSGCALILSGG